MEINTFLNSQWVKEEIKWEIKKYFEMEENEEHTKTYGMHLKQCLEENL